jgi:tetratricopeptide (TPR) repeat protein
LVNDLSEQASKAYESKEYEQALQSFEQIIAINNLEIIKANNPEIVDTLVFFNAGLSAFHSKNFKKAIDHYSKAAEYGFRGADCYLLIAKTYENLKDTASALKTLEKALLLYPGHEDVLNGMTSIYVKLNQHNEALSYLQKAIELDPDNAGYYYAQGTLYEKMKRFDKATQMYLEAIKIDSMHFDAHYNLGTLYYNNGVKQINKTSLLPAHENTLYRSEIKLANEWFEKSLPYIERCSQIQKENPAVLESLKNLYYRLKKLDRYNAVVYKLENLGIF